MIISLETVYLALTLIGEGCKLLVVISGKVIDLALVRKVQVLDSVQEILLSESLVLSQALDLLPQRVSLSYKLVLVLAVLLCIFSDLDTRGCDVDLKLISLVLGIADKFLVSQNVSLQVIDDLYQEILSEKEGSLLELILKAQNYWS
jgi:hypothetical protein